MRSSLVMGCLLLIACGGATATERPSLDSTPAPESPGAPGEGKCSERLPNAVFCRESEPGKPVESGFLSGDSAVVVVFPDRFDALEESRGVLRTITARTPPSSPYELPQNWVLDDGFCFRSESNAGALCAPFRGGAASEWLRPNGGDVIQHLAPVPGRFAIVSYFTRERTSYLRRVDREGGTVGEDLAFFDAEISWLVVIGESAVFAQSRAGSSTRKLFSVPLSGGAMTELFSFENEASVRFFAIGNKVTVVQDRRVSRVDAVTGTVEELAPHGSIGAFRQVGKSTVAISSDQVLGLDDQLRPVTTLLSVASPDRIGQYSATVGNALYVSVERSPCRVVGPGGKGGHTVCDETRGKWQILRVDVP